MALFGFAGLARQLRPRRRQMQLRASENRIWR
jgi:hypothetical protein